MSTPTINFNANPFFMHSFAPCAKGGATLVAFPHGDESRVIDSRQAYVAIAQCSEKDVFSRKTGRKIAEDRANDGKGFMIRFPSYATEQTKKNILRGILASFDLSTFD